MVRSDAIDLDRCRELEPDAIVISPGPRRPEDAGCSLDVLRSFDSHVPMLGVCLGHQAIAVAFGGRVIQCEPVHGMASQISHDGQGVFANCPALMNVGRYHSLAIDRESLPDELIVTASDASGLIMGVRHRTRPIFGVQFHPESILSSDGEQIIENFATIASSTKSRAAS
ncbi:Aminodeoxychorismate synthase component 2 [Rubripirellula obstinata]|uniref:Aminodeoxychorismate synthase component 2 n=1 Tax=Rubripirellula obstinata TaxID=406547 RepID=A0A5B1CHI2_9BACT|nr:Aminodeoxychorismate synthase component 2 [Rubripirellula obstinata]